MQNACKHLLFLLQLYTYTTYRWLLYGANEMIAQLEWLRDTLLSAEMNREKVHILGNIVCGAFTFIIHVYSQI